jgi:hypothetical protein
MQELSQLPTHAVVLSISMFHQKKQNFFGQFKFIFDNKKHTQKCMWLHLICWEIMLTRYMLVGAEHANTLNNKCAIKKAQFKTVSTQLLLFTASIYELCSKHVFFFIFIFFCFLNYTQSKITHIYWGYIEKNPFESGCGMQTQHTLCQDLMHSWQ